MGPALSRRPLWVSLTVWALVASLVAGAAGVVAGRAMGAGLQRLLESAAGRPGQYDVLVQVREEQAAEAASALRSLARSALGGARVRRGPAVGGSAGLLVDLPPTLERGSTFQNLGQLLQAVPGYVAWVPLVEPAVVVDSVHPALVARLEQELGRMAGVRFSFRHGSGVVVVADGPQEASAVARRLRAWLQRFRLFRVTLLPGAGQAQQAQGQEVARRLAGLLEQQGVQVLHVEAGRSEPSPAGAAADRMAQLLIQYATTAVITYGPHGVALARGDEVRVGSWRAVVVQADDRSAVAVVTDGGVSPDAVGQALEVTRQGRAVGTARLQGIRLEVQGALRRAQTLLNRLQAVQAEAAHANDLLQKALEPLSSGRFAPQGSLNAHAARDTDAVAGTDAVRDTLVALALSALLGRRSEPAAPPGELAPPRGGAADLGPAERLQAALGSLQEQLAALSRGELAPTLQGLRELEQRLPEVDGATVVAALRTIDPQGGTSGVLTFAEVLAEGSRLPAVGRLQQSLGRAVTGFSGRIHESAAGLLTPSPRAAAMVLTERAQALMALVVAGLVAAYTFLNDWATVVAASLAALAGAREHHRRRARVGWQLAGAVAGASVAALAGGLAAASLPVQALVVLAAAGAAVGWLSARLAPRLARVDPDPVEAARAFGLDGSAILTEVVLPQARPWLLAWLHHPLRQLRGWPRPGRLPPAQGDRARPRDRWAAGEGAPHPWGSVAARERSVAVAVAVQDRPAAAQEERPLTAQGILPGGSRRSRPAPWPVLEAQGIVKRFGPHTALDGFSLRLSAGETVVLMGPSGCGKSTALRCLAGLCEPDAGSLRAFGQELAGAPVAERRRLLARIAIVFQRPQLVGHLTVQDNVALPLVAEGVPLEQARKQARACLQAVELEGAADRLPHQLSGGEGQRVAIARALARRPEIILWDEPTAHLDPARVAELLQLVQELARRLRTTMLIVTHQGRFACQVAHRLVPMDRGQVVEEGPPEAVLARPRSDVGRRFAALAAL